MSTRAAAGLRLVSLTGWALIASGATALALAATVKLLPHDTAYLGMSVDHLCTFHGCRVVRFMAHDRTAFGGALIALGVMYRWMASVPLKRGERWAWWGLAASGLAGFASFLTYLGYGYLDVWHGRATLALLPVFAGGLALSFPRRLAGAARERIPLASRLGLGRALLAFTGLGMVLAGATITAIGVTRVFVPQDLAFMAVEPADLHALSPRLVPLIAHDRAGFGGGLVSAGLAILACSWFGIREGEPTLWRALALAGSAGFAAALGVHFLIGYTSLSHLAPAYAGALGFAVGISLLREPMAGGESGDSIGGSRRIGERRLR
jgi:hypothetical protein